MDWLGDILQVRRAQIAYRDIEPALHLPVSLLRETNTPRLRDTLEPSRNIDAVSHKIAVAFFDNVTDVDANPKNDAPLRGNAGVALDHGILNFHRAIDRVDDAPKLNDS